MATDVALYKGSQIFFEGTMTPDPSASPTFTGTVTLPAVIVAASLPTADPQIAGHLWSDSGVVTVSAG
jgi:hypothetical protein